MCVCTQRVGQLKGRVCLDSITAVEFVEESAFNLPHTFQVSGSACELMYYCALHSHCTGNTRTTLYIAVCVCAFIMESVASE